MTWAAAGTRARARRGDQRARATLDQLGDERSRRVILVSHCLLNENTRYAGGATRPGAVTEAVDELMAAGYGIHQLPCPERHAWGGVLKRRSLLLYGSRGRAIHALRRPLLRVFTWWTRFVYRRIAGRVVRDVIDYKRSGMTVGGIVGIGGSPSCGVTSTLDLSASLDVLAACPVTALTRDTVNRRAVLDCGRPGTGLFIEALDQRLRRRGCELPAWEHDLATELDGDPQSLLAVPARRTLGRSPFQ
jgi:predicted secreted protein